MISKQTWVFATDNTNVRWLRTFHLYKGFRRQSSEVSFFIKGSARIVEPPRLEYKGFKFKFNKKGDVCRMLLVRTLKIRPKSDGTGINLFTNAGILIKKKQNVKSKYINGPTVWHLKRKKFKSLFQTLL